MAASTVTKSRVDVMEESKAAHGVWAPALVPVRDDLSIDAQRFMNHARWLLDQGCHGLALFGTTGEANSFSVKERIGLLSAALDAGIPPLRFMVGTGCCALADSVRLTAHAAKHGCKRVLMLPPFYYKGVSDDGLFRSFAEVIERVGDPDLRVFLYHFPALSGVPITMGLIERLLDAYPNTVVGIKDSSGDWQNTDALIRTFPGLAVFPGSERFLLPALEAGGVGSITATANVNPAAIRAVYDAWRGGDDDPQPLQDAINVTRSTVEVHPTVAALKYIVAHLLDDRAWRVVCPPLTAMDESVGQRLVATLSEQGVAR